MASHWAFVIPLFAVAVVALSSGERDSRIVGGSSVTIQEYPSIVQVESLGIVSWSQACAGAIITIRHVLTAAHCMDGLLATTNRRRVRAGTATRNRGGVVLNIARVMAHPTYNSNTNEGDLAILDLSTSFQYSTTIQPATIIVPNFELPDDLPVQIVGWGSTRTGGSGSASTLQHATAKTVNRETCAELHPSRVVSQNMLCTGDQEDGVSACSGDEGGPVFYDNIVVGIVSWRRGCSNASVPDVHTRVASYTGWIVINAS